MHSGGAARVEPAMVEVRGLRQVVRGEVVGCEEEGDEV